MTVAATPAAPDATLGDRIDDASITAQVKSSLLSPHSTSALHTKVSTSDGVVTFIHILLVVAIVMVLVNLISGCNRSV
jgi:osmotically-inducible protein OsmY